jgi:hypothetical protein
MGAVHSAPAKAAPPRKQEYSDSQRLGSNSVASYPNLRHSLGVNYLENLEPNEAEPSEQYRRL